MTTIIHNHYHGAPNQGNNKFKKNYRKKKPQKFAFTNGSLRQTIKEWFKNPVKVEEKHGPMGTWDVSRVTNMDKLFKNRKFFDEDIGDWDVSNVKSMYEMFYGADQFDQNISGWDVSKVTNLLELFDEDSSIYDCHLPEKLLREEENERQENAERERQENERQSRWSYYFDSDGNKKWKLKECM